MPELLERKGLVRLRLITQNARLVDARKAAGFTQPAFATVLGMGKFRMHQIETLKRMPTEDEICRIAVALEQMPEYLFPDRLLKAVQAGVFEKRQVELEAPHLDHLIELRHPMLLTDGGIDEVEERVDGQRLRNTLEELFKTLTPRQVAILKLRFGFDGKGPRTLEEVGKVFNVQRERVRQIEDKALRLLRHPTRSRLLKDYLE